ncbi:cytochrome o ubiquinol oxidase subunit IV [Tumebacillus flagellatus]|uniref:Quinol oxidase subunit 4 n=1 Tax=Tumebacillus flagellatus TaxID=1157490 RepID=A0A074LQF2_9BACL|nr:cytochrome C oxidase subunit IV family protein [Tumebacillus flagellatus]KEO82715.1 hypothetical protein EL26_14210 [Tumebacillus flagellatus]
MANTNSHAKHESPKMYIIGFILSIVLTLAAWWLTEAGVMAVKALIFTIVILAALQIVVQLFFFMHITEKTDGPRYHVMGLILGLMFTVLIVGGSIWIMSFNSMVS